MFQFFRRQTAKPRLRFHGIYLGQVHDGWACRDLSDDQRGTLTHLMDNCALYILEPDHYVERFASLQRDAPAATWLAWDEASLCLMDHPRIDTAGHTLRDAEPGLHLFCCRPDEIAYAWASSRHFPRDTGLPAALHALYTGGRHLQVPDAAHAQPDADRMLDPRLLDQHRANTHWLAPLHDRMTATADQPGSGPPPTPS